MSLLLLLNGEEDPAPPAGLPEAAQRSQQGGGLLFAGELRQGQGVAGPVLVPAAAVEMVFHDLAVPLPRPRMSADAAMFAWSGVLTEEFPWGGGGEMPTFPQRRLDGGFAGSPDGVAVPDVPAPLPELPFPRRPFPLGEGSPAVGQADVVAAPDLLTPLPTLPLPLRRLPVEGHTPFVGQADPVPDISPAFADIPVRRKIDLRHTQSSEFGEGDPPAPDLVSLPPPDLFRRPPPPWLRDFAQNVEPLEAPALLSSFWTGLYPSGPFPKLGLLPALQQAYAGPPPSEEVIVQAGSWRPAFPDYLFRLARLVPGEGLLPPNPAVIAEGVPCIALIDSDGTYSTLIASVGTTSTLLLPGATMSHLADPEFC